MTYPFRGTIFTPVKYLTIAAALIVAAPLPARAADPACAITRTTPEFRVEIAVAMTRGDESESERLSQTLSDAVQACADAAGYDDQQGAAYFDFVLSEISRGWLIGELGKVGLSHVVIDKALDFGAGRTNSTLEEDISEAQIGAIISGYVAGGVEIEKVPQQAWELVGAYAAATGIYWQAAGKLP